MFSSRSKREVVTKAQTHLSLGLLSFERVLCYNFASQSLMINSLNLINARKAALVASCQFRRQQPDL